MEVKDASVEALLRGAVVDGQHVAELKEMDNNIPSPVIIVRLMVFNLTFASIASGFIAILEDRDGDLECDPISQGDNCVCGGGSLGGRGWICSQVPNITCNL